MASIGDMHYSNKLLRNHQIFPFLLFVQSSLLLAAELIRSSFDFCFELLLLLLFASVGYYCRY
jgi:hypothetical protein